MEEDSLALLVSDDRPPAEIRFGTRRREIVAGRTITFGRGASCDIRFGADPLDDFVSRTAGSVTGLPDGLLVRNTSSTKLITLYAVPGPETTIRPGAAVGTMPHRRCQLVVPGRFGHCYTLHLDVRPPAEVDDFPAPRAVPAPGATASGSGHVTARELRMLTALCGPMLTTAGGAPATYRAIAEMYGTTANSVRTCLDRLRARLSDIEGIPGLRASEDDSGVAQSYLLALAWWAIDTGVVAPEPATGART